MFINFRNSDVFLRDKNNILIYVNSQKTPANGTTIVYICKKLTDKEYAFQTNSNLYAYTLADKKTRLLTPDMPGYDKNPQFSPDGKQLLWSSMRRGVFEADKKRIMLMDVSCGDKCDSSADQPGIRNESERGD